MEDNHNDIPKHIKWIIFAFKILSICLGIWMAYDFINQVFIKN
jgi:hypothetical protein